MTTSPDVLWERECQTLHRSLKILAAKLHDAKAPLSIRANVEDCMVSLKWAEKNVVPK